MWLLKTDDKTDISPELQIDMSRYFTNISDELDRWLFRGSDDLIIPGPDPEPASENPWLMSSRSTRSRSHSPAYSRASSTSFKSQKRQNNKWLLSTQSSQSSSMYTCPFMERYQNEMKNLNWLKSEQPFEGGKSICNPLSGFDNQNSDMSKWLKPVSFEKVSEQEKASPMASLLDKYSKTTSDQWLLGNKSSVCDTDCKFVDMGHFDGDEGRWLMPVSKISPSLEEEIF